LTFGKLEEASGSSVRQKITLQQGIPTEKAKEIVRLVKTQKRRLRPRFREIRFVSRARIAILYKR